MNSVSSDPTRAAGSPGATHVRAHDGEGSSCGELLRRARERRGLTLQQISQDTKIPLRHLSALERDEFAALPGGMYRRAEVRAYADAVGLDRSVALSWLDHALEQTVPRTAPSVQVAVPQPVFASVRARVLLTSGVAVAAGVIAFATWVRQPGAADVTSLAAPVPPLATSVVPVPAAPNQVLVATSGSIAEPASAPPSERPEPATVPASALEPRLTVITEPAGARVTVNGVGWGLTPIMIRYLPPGPKRVRLTREGYRAEERVIQVGAGDPATTLRIPLEAQAEEDGASPVVLTEADGTRN